MQFYFQVLIIKEHTKKVILLTVDTPSSECVRKQSEQYFDKITFSHRFAL